MKALRPLGAILLLAGCQSAPMPPLAQAEKVDLARFMGDWYVIANIPTFIEKGAHNAIESYRLDADGTIATTFTFRAGGFDGKPKRYTPRGYVIDRTSNAVWGMQFIWPLKSDYRIVYLSAGLQPDRDRAQQARLRLDHGAHAADTRAPITSACCSSLANRATTCRWSSKVPQRWDAPR